MENRKIVKLKKDAAKKVGRVYSRIQYFNNMKQSGMMQASTGIIKFEAKSATVKFILQVYTSMR